MSYMNRRGPPEPVFFTSQLLRTVLYGKGTSSSVSDFGGAVNVGHFSSGALWFTPRHVPPRKEFFRNLDHLQQAVVGAVCCLR